MKKAHDDRLAATVQVEVSNRIAQDAVGPQAPKDAFEVTKAINRGGLVDRPAPRAAEERGDGGGDTRDGAHAAGDFFDVNAGIGQGSRHNVLSSMLWIVSVFDSGQKLIANDPLLHCAFVLST